MPPDAAVAEAEVTTPVTTEEQITPVTGDAGEQPVADAAEPGSEVATPVDETPEQYAERVLGESKEGDGQKAPEPTQRQGVDPAKVREAVQTFRTNHENRQRSLDALEADLEDAGLPQSVAKRFVKEAKDALNAHHADSLQYAGYEASEQATQTFQEQLRAGLSEGLAPATFKGFQAKLDEFAKSGQPMPYADVFKTVYELGQADGKSSGYKEGLIKGNTDGRAAAERVASASSSGQRAKGGGAPGPASPTWAQLLENPDLAKTMNDDQYRAAMART